MMTGRPLPSVESLSCRWQTGSAKADGQRGFTLLEILIAITITAILGTGAFYLLNQGVKTKDFTEDRAALLGELQRSQRILAADLAQVVPRSVRGEYGDRFYALSNLNALTLIELTRTGWKDPGALLSLLDEETEVLPRSQLQRVSYEIEEEDLYRLYWPVLDRAQDTTPVRQKVLSGVTKFKFRFLDENNQWSDTWPPNEQLVNNTADPFESLPKAVEYVFNHEKFGEIRRVFMIAGYKKPAATTGSSGESGDGETGDGSTPPEGETGT